MSVREDMFMKDIYKYMFIRNNSHVYICNWDVNIYIYIYIYIYVYIYIYIYIFISLYA